MMLKLAIYLINRIAIRAQKTKMFHDHSGFYADQQVVACSNSAMSYLSDAVKSLRAADDELSRIVLWKQGGPPGEESWI